MNSLVTCNPPSTSETKRTIEKRRNMYSLSRNYFIFYHDPSNHSRMCFQPALIQFQRSHIHALLLTLRKVAMSKYNTKWPFDLKMYKNYAMVWERYTCQFILLMCTIHLHFTKRVFSHTVLVVLYCYLQ